MSIDAFGDESGIHKLGYACYGIGAFFLPSDTAGSIEAELKDVCSQYGLVEELKWNRIGKFRASIETAVAGVSLLLSAGCGFHAMVVEKRTYQKWNSGDEEDAFYTSYYQFARNLSRRFSEPIRLLIDDRSDRYPHRAEVLHTVTNRALAKIQSSGTVAEVTKVDSKSSRVLQLADIMIGGITADTNLYLGGTNPLNAGKLELIARLGALLGWDGLRYDTMPNDVLNVWHFPREFRARPATRRITPNGVLPMVAAASG